MNSHRLQMSVRLSQLVPSRRNPRKVKPAPQAHQCLVALIRSQGLLQPLVVRPIEGRRYEVVAGERRLRALREIHKGNGDPKIPCVIRDVDSATADALSLGENFARAAMHPLDEAEAFAKLATGDNKDAAAIASEFGVPEHYVRQRMKLAMLAEPVKAAHRRGDIDTSIAEAFAAVPQDRQLEVWQELNGNPRHAEHVRNIIAHAWIDSTHAAFDVSALPHNAISRDLFGDRVLVERAPFLEAQAKAMEAQRQALLDDGWKEVAIGRREDIADRLLATEVPEREFDKDTVRKLEKIAARRQKLENAAQKIDDDDQVQLERFQQRYEELETQEREIMEQAPEFFSEETKALATLFLILDPDGRIRRECRVPRRRHSNSANGPSSGHSGGVHDAPEVPTSDELSDKQLGATFTHQALAVREALLNSAAAQKRVLALILHEKVRSEALAVRHDANSTTICASSDGFQSPAFNRLREKRAKLDPLEQQAFVDDVQAYDHIGKLSANKLDALINLLVVECVSAHLRRPTGLVQQLALELKVNVRDHWRPDADWLSCFQKIQLAHLITQLKGPMHAPPPERKKSELVEALVKLFSDAADGKLEDKSLAERVNSWLPSCLRRSTDDESQQSARSNKGG